MTPINTRVTPTVPPPRVLPSTQEMIGTGEAAALIGRTARQLVRWVDNGKIRGGRPIDPETGEPVENSHRWVDARHAVLYAIGSGRQHLIPEKYRHLIPQEHQPAKRHAA